MSHYSVLHNDLYGMSETDFYVVRAVLLFLNVFVLNLKAFFKFYMVYINLREDTGNLRRMAALQYIILTIYLVFIYIPKVAIVSKLASRYFVYILFQSKF